MMYPRKEDQTKMQKQVIVA